MYLPSPGLLRVFSSPNEGDMAAYTKRDKSMSRPLIWTARSAYPSETVPGIGLSYFSRELARLSDENLLLKINFECRQTSAQLLAAAAQANVHVGDLYGGPLSGVDPFFGINTLPFLSASAADAKQLVQQLRPSYIDRFRRLGVELLYISPWPTTSLWSSTIIRSCEDLARLRIRTYDELSASVMNAAGALAVEQPIADAIAALKSGSIQAILSSGDGEAGVRFRGYLPYLYDIKYASPVSFVVVNYDTLHQLSPLLQSMLAEAAAHTEAYLWSTLESRAADSRKKLLDTGVTVFPALPEPVANVLHHAAKIHIQAWTQSLATQDRRLINTYLQR